jgi:hypothetical protein
MTTPGPTGCALSGNLLRQPWRARSGCSSKQPKFRTHRTAALLRTDRLRRSRGSHSDRPAIGGPAGPGRQGAAGRASFL